MVKKLILIALISLFIITLTVPAYCDTSVTKLGRGLANIGTFWLEVPEQITRTSNSDGPVAAGTVGVLKGIGCSLIRFGVGVYETFTFPFPVPKDYLPILRDPEYFLQDSSY